MATTEEAAVERLLAYVPRYVLVTKLAGMEAAFATVPVVDVVERYVGTGSTDFWGISFAFSSIDQQAMSDDALERELALMRACWTCFDAVRSRVSAEMQRGPRGGGLDWDHIVRHTFATEQDWANGARHEVQGNKIGGFAIWTVGAWMTYAALDVTSASHICHLSDTQATLL